MYVPSRPINRGSPVPFYYQLQEILKEEIEEGIWSPGDFLPSESDLAKAHGISRTVIREALDVLESDGQIFRVKGKGTLVARRKFRYEALLTGNGGDSGAEFRFGTIIDARRSEVGPMTAALLNLPPGTAVFELTYTQQLGAEVASLSQCFLAFDASPGLERLAADGASTPEFKRGGPEALTQLAQRYGVAVAETDLTIEGSVANDFEAQTLGAKRRAAVFLLTTLDRSPAGRPVRFSRTVVRNDLTHFFMVIRRRGTGNVSGEQMILAPRPTDVDRSHPSPYPALRGSKP